MISIIHHLHPARLAIALGVLALAAPAALAGPYPSGWNKPATDVPEAHYQFAPGHYEFLVNPKMGPLAEATPTGTPKYQFRPGSSSFLRAE